MAARPEAPVVRGMDLILWRHAEAHEHPDEVLGRPGDALDLARRLTPRGEKQASRVGAWLDRQLPEAARIWCSPAARCEQTARALGRRYKLAETIAPEASLAAVLELVQWPDGKGPVVVVGHQPTLGRVIAELMGMPGGECSVKKGAVWWLRHRERAAQGETVIVTVQTPEML